LDCSLSYGGLKRKLFQIELKEYLDAMKYNKHKSSFATHILSTGHIYGDTKHNGSTAMYKKGTTHQYNRNITFTL